MGFKEKGKTYNEDKDIKNDLLNDAAKLELLKDKLTQNDKINDNINNNKNDSDNNNK